MLQFDPKPIEEKFEAVWKFMRSVIQDHREKYDENNIRDLVDLHSKKSITNHVDLLT